MSVLLLEPAMPKNRNGNKQTASSSGAKGRVEFKAPESWILRAEKTAESIGLSLSAYIRMLVTEDMDRRDKAKE